MFDLIRGYGPTTMGYTPKIEHDHALVFNVRERYNVGGDKVDI